MLATRMGLVYVDVNFFERICRTMIRDDVELAMLELYGDVEIAKLAGLVCDNLWESTCILMGLDYEDFRKLDYSLIQPLYREDLEEE